VSYFHQSYRFFKSDILNSSITFPVVSFGQCTITFTPRDSFLFLPLDQAIPVAEAENLIHVWLSHWKHRAGAWRCRLRPHHSVHARKHAPVAQQTSAHKRATRR
jgi:hypothetical protein